MSFAILLLRAPHKPSRGPFRWAFWEPGRRTPGRILRRELLRSVPSSMAE